MTVTIVTGCHRSGTSARAGQLAACGWVWHHGHPMPADQFNAPGYFEDLDVVDLHAGALARACPASNGWRYYGAPLEFTPGEQDLARRLVAQRSRHAWWGFKDPRATWFLNAWRQLIPGLLVIHVSREKAATVNSLVRRGDCAPSVAIFVEEAGAMWEAYHRAAHLDVRKYPQEALLLE